MRKMRRGWTVAMTIAARAGQMRFRGYKILTSGSFHLASQLQWMLNFFVMRFNPTCSKKVLVIIHYPSEPYCRENRWVAKIFASPPLANQRQRIISSHNSPTPPSSSLHPLSQLMSGTTRPQAEQLSLALKTLSANISRDEKERANGFLESFQKSVSFLHSSPPTDNNNVIWY